MDLVYPYLPILQKVLDQVVKDQAEAALAVELVTVPDQAVEAEAVQAQVQVLEADQEVVQVPDLEAEVELIYPTQKHKTLLVEQLENQDAMLVVDLTPADTGTLQFTMQTVIM